MKKEKIINGLKTFHFIQDSKYTNTYLKDIYGLRLRCVLIRETTNKYKINLFVEKEHNVGLYCNIFEYYKIDIGKLEIIHNYLMELVNLENSN